MENTKDTDVIMQAIVDSCVDCASGSGRSDEEVLAAECVKCVESRYEITPENVYPVPRPEVSDEVVKSRLKKEDRPLPLENFVKNDKGITIMSMVLLLCITICCALLVLLNNDAVMAGTAMYESGNVTPINAVLWSIVGVLSFLLILVVVFVVALKLRDRGINSKVSVD